MENIFLFVLTVVTYFSVWNFIKFTSKPDGVAKYLKRIALIALLALPININGNVYTVAGNATAKENVISLFSLYQRAGKNAITILGPSYQQAGQDAVTIIGLSYQRAGEDAVTGVGFMAYQQASYMAKVPIAIALYQRVGEKTRSFAAFSKLTSD